MGLVVLVIGALSMGGTMAQATITIVGEVNDEFQIVTDSGDAYNVYANDVGNEVVEQTGAKVTIRGDVETVEGEKWITIQSFELVADKDENEDDESEDDEPEKEPEDKSEE